MMPMAGHHSLTFASNFPFRPTGPHSLISARPAISYIGFFVDQNSCVVISRHFFPLSLQRNIFPPVFPVGSSNLAQWFCFNPLPPRRSNSAPVLPPPTSLLDHSSIPRLQQADPPSHISSAESQMISAIPPHKTRGPRKDGLFASSRTCLCLRCFFFTVKTVIFSPSLFPPSPFFFLKFFSTYVCFRESNPATFPIHRSPSASSSIVHPSFFCSSFFAYVLDLLVSHVFPFVVFRTSVRHRF